MKVHRKNVIFVLDLLAETAKSVITVLQRYNENAEMSKKPEKPVTNE